MNRKLFCITLVLLLGIAAELSAQNKKYGIQSGIVTFEEKTDLGAMEICKKYVVYFDDYGNKERKDTYDEEGVLTESFFSDGEELYLIIHSDHTAYKRGKAYRGTEYKFSWDEIRKADKESGKAEKLGNVVIAGKDCESYQMKTKRNTTTFAGWEGICLLTDIQMQRMRITGKAVSFEENAAVPKDKFTVPVGMEIKEAI